MADTALVSMVPTAVLTDTIATIDAALATMQHRELVSTDEVTDLLLDLRHRLTADG